MGGGLAGEIEAFTYDKQVFNHYVTNPVPDAKTTLFDTGLLHSSGWPGTLDRASSMRTTIFLNAGTTGMCHVVCVCVCVLCLHACMSAACMSDVRRGQSDEGLGCLEVELQGVSPHLDSGHRTSDLNH